jgi:nitrilase
MDGTESSQRVRVAVVQAAPVFLDREGCIAKTVEFIQEAQQQHVDLVAFPEGFVPGHPLWYHFHPATSATSLGFATELFKNSVEVPGPQLDAVCEACADGAVNVVLGVCERRRGSTGTMFNTQLVIDAAGNLLGKHQKLTPTVGERLVHAGGYGDGLRVFDTDAGRVSGLICGENSNPLAIMALGAQGTQIHVASWPNHFSRNEHRMADAITFATRSLSYKLSCFVLNACGTVSPEMIRMLPYTGEDAQFLEDHENAGGSSIIGADSMIISGPMDGRKEGLLTAEIDLDDCIRAKVVHDYSGHYNRPDVFSLTVNRGIPALVRERDDVGLDVSSRGAWRPEIPSDSVGSRGENDRDYEPADVDVHHKHERPTRPETTDSSSLDESI